MKNQIAGEYIPLSLTSIKPNPERLRDWISVPKGNGYESLHTTVMGQQGRWVEVQIRSTRMDDIAEKGYAAHWKYKGNHLPVEIQIWKNGSKKSVNFWKTRNRMPLILLMISNSTCFLTRYLFSRQRVILLPFPAMATALDRLLLISIHRWARIAWAQKSIIALYHWSYKLKNG